MGGKRAFAYVRRHFGPSMREAAFIQRNQTKWKLLEVVLAAPSTRNADEIAALYVEVNDDLSYARTFYPRSNVVTYLNGLATRLHQHVYRNKRTQRGRFVTFWTREVPAAMYATRKQLLLSFGIFAGSMLIGIVSAHHDTLFPRLILGDGYVEMTLENIRKGEPMAVYGDSGEAGMFLRITRNNVQVALTCFVLGILGGFGTAYFLMYNGIMVGAFQYFFYQHGVLGESARTIWVHGTLEISAIIVAGAAGLTLGKGLLFPGTYTRLHSLRTGAMLGLKVVMGLVPVFILAGFLESFVTRHALSAHPAMALSVIAISAAFVVYYFIIRPYHVERSALEAAPGARLR